MDGVWSTCAGAVEEERQDNRQTRGILPGLAVASHSLFHLEASIKATGKPTSHIYPYKDHRRVHVIRGSTL